MKKESRIKETLVDLIKVNTQRLQGYSIVLENWSFNSEDLRNSFEKKIEQIYQHIQDLRFQLRVLGGPSIETRTISSRIFSLWVELKKSFGYDVSSFGVKNCLDTEEVVDSAYQTVLDDEDVDDYNIRQILFDHHENIRRDLSSMQLQFS